MEGSLSTVRRRYKRLPLPSLKNTPSQQIPLEPWKEAPADMSKCQIPRSIGYYDVSEMKE